MVLRLATGEDDGVVLRLGAGDGCKIQDTLASGTKIRFRQIQRYVSVRCKDTSPSDAKIRFWVLIWPCRLDACDYWLWDWNAVRTIGML